MTTYRVRVTLVAECEVDIEVEADEGYDPCDLTRDEERRAIRDAEPLPRWSVKRVDNVVEVIS